MSYEKYFKDVSGFDVVDVYRVHRLFGVNDEVLCHASKKLLLSGVRTGGKTLEQDVREARDSLNRWLEMLAEDLCNEQEADGWTPQEIEADAFKDAYKEYILQEVVGDAVLSDWARWVAVDADGSVWEYGYRPISVQHGWFADLGVEERINKVVPPLNFKNCIWRIKK